MTRRNTASVEKTTEVVEKAPELTVCPGCWVCRQLEEPAVEVNKIIHNATADIDPATVRLNVDRMGSGIAVYARRSA